MAGRVIQAFFVAGRMPAALAQQAAPVRAPTPPARIVGAPPPAFSPHGGSVQAKAAPGRPPLAHRPAPVAQRAVTGTGTRDQRFAIDPVRIGLVRQGGSQLPTPLLAKMEAAFGADFSSVRVHIGPQAARIGAVAFTTGNDLYFAPGQYQPDTIKGQQLIGHELAHVIQQRQGRVRALDGGVSVVQDAMLEAEADRLGMRAASHVVPASARPAVGGAPVQRFAAGAIQPSKRGRGYTGPSKNYYYDDDDSSSSSSEDEEDPNDRDYRVRQERATFTKQQPEQVIRKHAHKKRSKNINKKKFRSAWTCPACGRPLAYEDLTGAFKLIDYSYRTKRKGKLETQRALELDHHPKPWAQVLSGLNKKRANRSQIIKAYRDPKNLRALCRVCNGSHKYEGVDVEDYDSDEDGYDPPGTPPHEPDNQGRWSIFA